MECSGTKLVIKISLSDRSDGSKLALVRPGIHREVAYLGLPPLAGNRNTNGHTLNNVGSNGYYWSATMNSTTNSYNLNMGSSGNTNPSNNNNRGNGFSVRCVAEL